MRSLSINFAEAAQETHPPLPYELENCKEILSKKKRAFELCSALGNQFLMMSLLFVGFSEMLRYAVQSITRSEAIYHYALISCLILGSIQAAEVVIRRQVKNIAALLTEFDDAADCDVLYLAELSLLNQSLKLYLERVRSSRRALTSGESAVLLKMFQPSNTEA